MSAGGAIRFARYAFPPNALHYCGPADSRALLEYADAEQADPGLAELAAGFEGAWPYLELIAHEAGIGDPLDDRVVEAYWIGNEMLDRVDRTRFGRDLERRFGDRSGWVSDRALAAVPRGALPNHSFHVFGVYPWVGLLRSGSHEPVDVLDRCRIRAGVVEDVAGDRAQVACRPLVWDGRRLGFGHPRLASVTTQWDGYSLAGPLRRGDIVSLHWDWVCERITKAQAAQIERSTAAQLDVVNGMAFPPPAAVVG